MFRVLFLAVLLFALVWGYFYLFEGGTLPILGGTLADAKTTASVKGALALHKDLAGRPISVLTRDAVVTLTGEVATEREKKEAERLAHSVSGVRQVDNLIAVTPELVSREPEPDRSLGQRLDDTTLAAKVKAALVLHRDLSGLDIEVRVREGTVTLEGEVDTRVQAEQARQRALSVEGVREVQTLLEVTGEPEVLASRIESVLRDNENLRQYRLRASSRDGAIVIEGQVATGAERELAELLAERSAGRLGIRNEIRIK